MLFRDAQISDMSFVYDSFCHEYKKSPFSENVPIGILISKLNSLLDMYKITILCIEEIPDEIIGYIIHNEDNIAWVHTKGIYRKQGFAKMLLLHVVPHLLPIPAPRLDIVTPFWNPKLLPFVNNLNINIRFRPYIPDVTKVS